MCSSFKTFAFSYFLPASSLFRDQMQMFYCVAQNTQFIRGCVDSVCLSSMLELNKLPPGMSWESESLICLKSLLVGFHFTWHLGWRLWSSHWGAWEPRCVGWEDNGAGVHLQLKDSSSALGLSTAGWVGLAWALPVLRRELSWSQCPRELLAPANEGPHPLTDLAFVVNYPSGSHPSRLP